MKKSAANRHGLGGGRPSQTASLGQSGIAVQCARVLAALALSLSTTQQSRALSFSSTGALAISRAGHAAVLLHNEEVLIVGGYNGGGPGRLASVELYNPAVGTWTTTGSLNLGRTTHTATLLPDGRVLVAGGHDSGNTSTATCELYDPATGTWTFTGAMATARGQHTATLLLNGKVLVAGGHSRTGGYEVSTTELYDPATGMWTTAGPLATARDSHTATLLLDGKVFVAGGSPDSLQYASLSSVEVYDPATKMWRSGRSMAGTRQAHTATLLPNGRVLVAAGFSYGYFIPDAELYDPAAGTWTSTGAMGTARGIHTATLLPDGRVLAVGGNHNTLNAPAIVTISTAEIYDPASGAWTSTGPLNAARTTHTATLLPSGRVLIAAGYNVSGFWLTSAELYGSASGPVTLVKPVKQPGGGFQFIFAGAGTNTVWMTTDPTLPLTNWTALGAAPEFAPGLFSFSDPQAASDAQRFYYVRSP